MHIEFLIEGEGGNSGVYLQNRYEIQVLDGDSSMHGLGAVINEIESPYYAYNGIGNWNSYDITFVQPGLRMENEVKRPWLPTISMERKCIQISESTRFGVVLIRD